MLPFIYDALPGRVVFGNGAVERIPDELDLLRSSRVLLISDRSAAALAERLIGQIGSRVVARIADVRVHVPVERAIEARRLARETDADVVVTFGGGSATGLGKAIALDNPIPILAVPTTYAGSEMTPIWGMTEGSRKQTGRDPRVQPRVVVYDPVLTLSLPTSIAAPSGMNAMAHCVEALYGPGANPITSLMAEEGIRTLVTGLPSVMAAPDDLDARGVVLVGAYLAGTAFAAAGSGIHHKICHVLGGAYDLPHAELHAVVLPHAIALVASSEAAAMARIAGAIGDPDVAGALFDLRDRLGIAPSLAAIGMPGDRLHEATSLIENALGNGPGSLAYPRASIEGLLATAYEGRRPSLERVPERVRSRAGVVTPGS